MPGALVRVAAADRTDTVGVALGDSLVVRVDDRAGDPLAGAAVEWSATGGALSATRVTTDAAGEAAVQWTLPTTAGEDTTTATVDDLAAIEFTATAVPDRPATVALSADTIDFGAAGDTVGVDAAVEDRHGNAIPDPDVIWAVDDTSVAEVSAAGAVVSRGEGSAVLSADADTARGTAVVRVDPVATSVSVEPSADTLNAVGDTVRPVASVTDANANPIEGASIEWTSLDTAVAAVDGEGRVVSAAQGTTGIVAASGEAADTMTLASTQVVESVTVVNTVSGESADTLEWGWEDLYTATAADSNGVDVPDTSSAWMSSDTSLVTVNDTGRVSVVFGFDRDVDITATTDGVSGTAAITVVSGDAEITIDNVDPSLIPTDSTTDVTVSAADPTPPGGVDFVDGAEVRFVDDAGDPRLAVDTVEFIDQKTLRAAVRTAPGDSGVYDVVVTNPDGSWGQAADGLEVVPADSLTATSPLIVTEIMSDPLSVPDADGEWFEIHNAGATALELDGLVVRDGSGETFTVADPVFVPAGGHVVLGANADTGVNGGVPVDYAYGSAFTLTDADDAIELVVDGTELDAVVYNAGTGFSVTEGAALSLDPESYGASANDDGANWCDAQDAYNADGDTGSPGDMNPSCL